MPTFLRFLVVGGNCVLSGKGSRKSEERAMQWITRERAKVDRIACPWLISRFIDPDPEFLYVPAARGAQRGHQTWGYSL